MYVKKKMYMKNTRRNELQTQPTKWRIDVFFLYFAHTWAKDGVALSFRFTLSLNVYFLGILLHFSLFIDLYKFASFFFAILPAIGI